MPRIHPAPDRFKGHVSRLQPPSNSSLTNINGSFLHENYLSPTALCQKCHEGGNQLIYPCNCDNQVYHPSCLKNLLRQRLKQNEEILEGGEQLKYILCGGCNHKIKMKVSERKQCQSCSDAYNSWKSRKPFMISCIVFSILFLGCMLYLILVAFDLVPNSNMMSLEKSALSIALGIIAGLLLIILLFCLFDCFTSTDFKIETLYDRRARSQRSSRSHRSKNTKKSRSDKKTVVIEDLQ